MASHSAAPDKAAFSLTSPGLLQLPYTAPGQDSQDLGEQGCEQQAFPAEEQRVEEAAQPSNGAAAWGDSAQQNGCASLPGARAPAAARPMTILPECAADEL